MYLRHHCQDNRAFKILRFKIKTKFFNQIAGNGEIQILLIKSIMR